MKTVEFGEYVKLTITHPLAARMTPGQCAKINDKWYAIAEQKDEEFDVYVRRHSTLPQDLSEVKITGPMGPGFSNPYAPKAAVIAGGTGLGAVLQLLRERSERSLPTSCLLFMKSKLHEGLNIASLCDEFEFVNTGDVPRKDNDTLISFMKRLEPGTTIFAAGPTQLVNLVRMVANESGMECTTNY